MHFVLKRNLLVSQPGRMYYTSSPETFAVPRVITWLKL